MSKAWNLEVSEEVLQERVLRARRVLAELQTVLTNTGNRKSVSEIARALECSRPKVIWMQHVLQLRRGEGRVDDLGTWPKSPEETP